MSFITNCGIIFGILTLALISCAIQNPTREDSVTANSTIGGVSEGVGNIYYIHRGLQHEFALTAANEALLNKTATLHLYRFWFGRRCGDIAKLEVDGRVLYT
ncbi:MAG: hypothetical protein CMC08_08335 [Flavobacteriaceae bacterium]|nr:hypothetical protein [Flavobacteriaceae bacterium]